MIASVKENTHDHEFIEQAHEAAVFLWKPGCHARIWEICPGHWTTRWISDSPLMRFLCEFYEEVTDILGRKKQETSS
jgi:hypothetical protein